MGIGLKNNSIGVQNLLAIHHVRQGPDQLAWDLGFLAWGAVMLIGGWLLARTQEQPAQ